MKQKMEIKRVDIGSPDDFSNLEDYIAYLSSLKLELLLTHGDNIYLQLDSEEMYYTERLQFFIKVLREETDSEYKTRMIEKELVDEKTKKAQEERELETLRKLKLKYGE